MNQISRSRVQLFAVLFGVIFMVHAAVIGYTVLHGNRKEAPASPGKTEEKSGGESGKKGAPAPRFRFRRPSSNPRFGAPLDFSGALHGNLPERLVPGASGVGTGILIDADSRKVLWEKKAFKPVPVASMVKMMTMLLAMEALDRDPSLSLDTSVPVTKAAWSVPRTGVLYLAKNEAFTIRELMLAIAVKSANDAATQMAEFIAGSVPAFVERMNRRATELGLRGVRFLNPCGLPDRKRRNSLATAADMVLLGERLLEYPDVLNWCQRKSGSIRNGKTVFVNTNHLINPHYPGVEGLKTGYTRASGSCLTFSVRRNQRRFIGCVTGFRGSARRDRFCRRLIDWAYRGTR